MTWRNSVNQNPQSSRIADIQQYVKLDSLDSISPIDSFYSYSQELLKVGDVSFLTNHPKLGGLLLVGLISCTENYFRDILSRIVSLCPIAQSHAADENISIGAVVWHEPTNALRGAFEYLSFAASKNIMNSCHKFTGIQLNGRSSIFTEFDKVCELRHGVVHAGSSMPGKNAIKLQLPSHKGIIRISVGFSELQEAGSICTNLVAGINQELFDNMISRWAEGWRRLSNWNVSDEDLLFEKIWNLFFSQNDMQQGLISNLLNLEQCKSSVKIYYGLS